MKISGKLPVSAHLQDGVQTNKIHAQISISHLLSRKEHNVSLGVIFTCLCQSGVHVTKVPHYHYLHCPRCLSTQTRRSQVRNKTKPDINCEIEEMLTLH